MTVRRSATADSSAAIPFANGPRDSRMSQEGNARNRTPAWRNASRLIGVRSGTEMKTACVALVRFAARESATGSREYARASFAAGSAAKKTGEYGYSTSGGARSFVSHGAGAATGLCAPVGIVRCWGTVHRAREAAT